MDDGSYGSKFIEILPFEKPTKRPDISDVTHQKVQVKVCIHFHAYCCYEFA